MYLGREIAHVMGFEGADWLERDIRQKEEKTDLALLKMPINSSSIVLDVGAGTGYYSFKLSSLVPQGKVYAEEVQDEMLQYLANRKNQLGLKNVELIKGSFYSVPLPPGSVDVALMVDVYHEFLYPAEMLSAINKVLKPGGKIVLLEYRSEDEKVPIKRLHKMSVDQVNREFSAGGFKLTSDLEFLPWQHFLILQKM